MTDKNTLSAIANSVLVKQANAILTYASQDGSALVQAIELINQNDGPVIVSGVGKSGHIAQKIASTMRSLGTPSIFLHAAEASHGDLGIIHKNSTVIVLSNSGETTELSDLLHYCKNHGNPVISLTSKPNSTLAKFSDVVLCYGDVDEGCINGLAPTTSTTICLAIGDSLAVGVSHLKNIAPEDFRRWHPGGKLGSRLSYVRDVMRTDNQIPKIRPDASITEALLTMSEKSVGCVVVCDADRVLGVVTDGDMRRNMSVLGKTTIMDIATTSPIYIPEDILTSQAAEIMSQKGITTSIVGEPGQPVKGFIHIHDCLSAGDAN